MIAPIPMGQMEVEGLDGLEQAFLQALNKKLPVGDVVFEVHTGGARGAAKNKLIAEVQARRDRNPFYVNDKTKAALARAARGLATTAFSTRRVAEETIKQLLLGSILDNVRAQRNPLGAAFRPLTANYAAAKRRIHGFTTPILRATGDLLGGLKVRIRR